MPTEGDNGRNAATDCFPILAYHGIGFARRRPAQEFEVSLDDFTRHMDLLAASERRVHTISDLAAPLSRGHAMSRSASGVTFDDGTADFYDRAYPVLRDRGLSATLYVVSGLVGKRYQGRKMLAWEQLEELRDGGIEIGAHSHRHIPLDVVPLDRAAEEVVVSKVVLEDRLQTAVNSFAYPFGYHTAAVKRLVAGSGYSSACAVKNRLSYPYDDRYALARVTVTANTTPHQMEELVEGRGTREAWSGERLRTRLWRLYRRHRGLTAPSEVELE